jgi:hypothetical protein
LGKFCNFGDILGVFYHENREISTRQKRGTKMDVFIEGVRSLLGCAITHFSREPEFQLAACGASDVVMHNAKADDAKQAGGPAKSFAGRKLTTPPRLDLHVGISRAASALVPTADNAFSSCLISGCSGAWLRVAAERLEETTSPP